MLNTVFVVSERKTLRLTMESDRVECHTDRNEFKEDLSQQEQVDRGDTVTATHYTGVPRPDQGVMAALEALGKDISKKFQSVTARLWRATLPH